MSACELLVISACMLMNVFCCDVLQKRVPIYKTMFSELQCYPRYEVRLDTVDPVPRFIARNWRGQQSDAAVCNQRHVPLFLDLDSCSKMV